MVVTCARSGEAGDSVSCSVAAGKRLVAAWPALTFSVPDGLVCWRQREVNGRSLIFNISALFIPTVNIASILNY